MCHRQHEDVIFHDRTETPVFTVSAAIRAEAVAYDAATDGCFPLITNDIAMSPAEVLAASLVMSGKQPSVAAS